MKLALDRSLVGRCSCTCPVATGRSRLRRRSVKAWRFLAELGCPWVRAPAECSKTRTCMYPNQHGPEPHPRALASGCTLDPVPTFEE